MVNVFNKIDNELLQNVSTQELNKQDCIVYARDYVMLKRLLSNREMSIQELPFIKAFAVSLDNRQILRFARLTEVNYITRQCRVFAQVNVAKKIMNIDKLYEAGVYGKGVGVAVIDTGISMHSDFCLVKNRIVKFVDLIGNQESPYDDNGHGTFVSSIIAGSGLLSGKKYTGVAPMSNIISIKAIESSGETGVVSILRSMQWVYDNRLKYNIRVVCMSFGSTPLDKRDPLLAGAEVLWNSGIVVVAAAGNSGPELMSIKSPGISPKIITVGGLDDGRVDEVYDEKMFKVAKFSSRGPAGYYYKPDCLAPAVDIMGASQDGDYTKMSGTSVATPMVAGLCALMISSNPHITPDQLKVRLLGSCHSMSGDRNEEGYGYIRINR